MSIWNLQITQSLLFCHLSLIPKDVEVSKYRDVKKQTVTIVKQMRRGAL